MIIMKKLYNFLVLLLAVAILFVACVEEQDDLRYNGPSVAEFKNRYLEIQTRLGTALFQSANYNVVTIENTVLSRLTVRQPAVVLTGVINASVNSATVTGQAAGNFNGSISGNTLTVTSAPTGGVLLGVGIEITGPGVAPNTVITRLTGTGTYAVSVTQNVAAATLSTVSTQFLTQLQVGSILKNATGSVIGVVSAIASNNSLTLSANAATAVTLGTYRASFAQGLAAPVFRDSILVQLVGKQSPSDITISYIKDPSNPSAPAGVTEAVEGVHYNLVRNNAGEVVIKGNSSAGYIYIDVLESLTSTDPDRVTLVLTLTNQGDIAPSENYKTFTYNIIK
jgi:hypothetical protein